MKTFTAVAAVLLSGAAHAAEPPFKAGPKQEWQPDPVRVVRIAEDKIVLEAQRAWVLMEADAKGKMTFNMLVDPEGHKIAIGLLMLATNCAIQRIADTK